MNYKKIAVLLSVLTLSVGTILGGCSQKTTETKTTTSSSASSSTSSNSESQDSTQTDDSAIFGQITAIDGDSITLSVMDNKGGNKGEKPSGDASNQNSTEKPQSPPSGAGQNSTEMPSNGSKGGDSSETSSDQKQGGAPQMSGETKTITISDSTVIEKEDNGSTTQGSTSDLEKGSMVSVTMDGDTVKMITIKNMQGGPSDGKGQGQSDSTQTTETSKSN